MNKLQSSPTILIFLVLCLGMITVGIAPVFIAVDMPIIDGVEIDSDTFEVDEDFFSANCRATEIIYLVCSRGGILHLNAKPAALARPFSPPKLFHI
jgi:hypothetical protein